MAKTRSMTRNQNHDEDASSRKKIRTCDSNDTAPWLELNDDLLLLVIMQLGIVDFLSFSGVCKAWRSLALSKRNIFMASRSPMSICISSRFRKKECCLKDFEGRKFKTILPHSFGRACIGFTCGYLILFGRKAFDFWLVNPLTRHELHFPSFPHYDSDPTRFRAILVFSSSLSGWVFVVTLRFFDVIWFSVAGSQAWTNVTSTSTIFDLHLFKGKIYALTTSCLCELKLYPKPKLTLLKTKNIPKPDYFYREFVSSGENLYVMNCFPEDRFSVLELDIGEMKWVVLPKKTLKDYALFLCDLKHGAAIKLELWVKSWSQYERYAYLHHTDESVSCRLFTADMWYFPHDCLNVNHIDSDRLVSSIIFA